MGAKTKTDKAMDEQKLRKSHDSLINLLLADGLENAIPKITELLITTAMLRSSRPPAEGLFC